MIGRRFNSIIFRTFSFFLIFTFLSLSFGCSKTKLNKNNVHAGSVLENRTISPGKIIFVSGSCSSGKSSMAKIIAQNLNAKSFAFDEYVMPIVLKKFITKHYGSFIAFFVNKFFMRNFFTSVDLLSEKQKYKMQIKFYNDLKQGMAIEPTTRMYKEVKKIASQGINVVVESPIYLWDGIDFLSCLNEFNGTNITYVLAYCPWNDLVDRIRQRNSSGNKKNHRELDWVLINYIYSLEVSSVYHGDNFLEYLSGENVHKTVAEYSKPEYKKKRLHLLAETQHAVLNAFPKNTYYYIYPRFKYDIIVNTKIHNPEQGAVVVLNHIQGNKTIS